MPITDSKGQPASGQFNAFVEALVVDNKDPQKLGRVKLKFPTLPGSPESTWARCAMPMAGQKRGWQTIPEVDDEVLVAFAHGDINSAVVVGALYNGVDTPPYANEDGNNDLRVFQSRSGHRVTFDDKNGSERIELITNNEQIKIVLDAKEKTLTIFAGKDIIIEATENIKMKCKDFKLEASNSVSVKAGMQMKLDGGQSFTVNGGSSLTIAGSLVKIN
jgi:phage baseplate assembly protein V